MAKKSLFLAAVIVIITASIVFASEDDYFNRYYYEDFIEGEDITPTMEELDILTFTYYGENYTFRVLSVHLQSSDVRVEKKALEILVNQTWSFNLDDDVEDYDLDVALLDINDGEATFRFSLYKKPEIDDEENITNSTNTTDNSTTNTTNNSDTPEANNTHNNDSTADNSADYNNETADDADEEGTESSNETKKSPTGGTVINITFNITLPPGSGIGLIVVIVIVLGGLLVYKKARVKMDKKTAEQKPGEKKPQPGFDYDKFKAKLKKKFDKARIKIAKKIGGEDFARKREKQRNKLLKP